MELAGVTVSNLQHRWRDQAWVDPDTFDEDATQCIPMWGYIIYDLTLFDTVRICLCDSLCKFDGFWIEWFRLGNCWNPSMFNKPKLAETKQQRIRWILSTCQALDVMSWSLLQFHSTTGNKRLAVPWRFMFFFWRKGHWMCDLSKGWTWNFKEHWVLIVLTGCDRCCCRRWTYNYILICLLCLWRDEL